MNLLPKSHEEFSKTEYWDNFFEKRGNKAFEWYGEYPELSKHLHKYIKTKDNILVVGCGNSTLSSDLYDAGYSNITSIDVSKVVIRQMLNIHKNKRPALKFIQMDALNMTFENEAFSVVLDKGTLDALMPNENPETTEKILKYFKEIERVLRIGGRYICVSLLQKHILRTVAEYFPQNSWMLRVIRCFEAERKTSENGERALPVFMVICTKSHKMPQQVLEVNVGCGDRMQRLSTTEEVLDIISNVQQTVFVCSNLKNISNKEYAEVSLDLYKPEETIPRFSVYLVNLPYERKRQQYAAFIVPQGREAEWMFSTKQGRKHLTEISNYNRLVIVTLHREQKYNNLEAVKSELEQTVQNLAPPNVTGKILFLSLGSDVGKRITQFKGESEISGKYVVEDVEVEKMKFRRLIFMSTQSIIQSEAKLKSIKTRRGHMKEVVDHLYLASKYHICMTIGCSLICEQKLSASIVILGLGGGSLCMFLKKFLKNAEITAVDIDADVVVIAQKWFGLELDAKLNVVIEDGLQFIQRTASSEKKYDCLIFDVDSKNTSLGISCPPKEFLEVDVIKNVVNCIKDNGLFVLNLVLRNKTLRPDVIKLLTENFKTLISYELEEDLNEVIFCFKEQRDSDIFKKDIEESCKKLNSFLKISKQEDTTVEVEDYLNKISFKQKQD